MSLILHPQNSFTVVRQIANHTDTGTYYVRAVIRNAYTDEILETLDLTDRGSQRFSKNWRVPPDTSGQGFYVSIVSSVYTDSGYTTKSDNYGDEENTYLVQARVPLGRGAGGGNLDAATIRRIVSEELDKRPHPDMPEIPEPKEPREYEMRWEEILEAIRNIPKPEPTDLSPVLTQLREVVSEIQNKEVTPETDLTPILSQIKEATQHLGLMVETRDNAITERVVEVLKQHFHSILKSVVNETTFSIAPTTAKMNAPEVQSKEPEATDISKLTL